MSRCMFAILVGVFVVGPGTASAYEAQESRASSEIAVTTGVGTLLRVLPGPLRDHGIGVATELKVRQIGLSAGFITSARTPTALTLEAKLYPFDAELGRGPWLGVGYLTGRTWTVSGEDWAYESESAARLWGVVGYSGYIGSHGLINVGFGGVRTRGNVKATFYTSFGLRKQLSRY